MSNKYAQFSHIENSPNQQNKRRTFKEIKMRPNIGANDFNIKLKQIVQFLEKGLQVRVTVNIRGRENAFKEEYLSLFQKINDGIPLNTGIMGEVKQAGNNYMRTINPIKKK